MAFKNKEERNAYERARRANNPEAARKAREATKRSEAKYPERVIERLRLSREMFPNKHRGYMFKGEMKRYGVTISWYRDKLIDQLGLCAICQHLNHSRKEKQNRYPGLSEEHKTLNRLQVDHDHKCCDINAKSCGKCVRGLICESCNLRLSYFEQILEDFPKSRKDICEVDFRNMVQESSWTKLALRYLKKYQKVQV